MKSDPLAQPEILVMPATAAHWPHIEEFFGRMHCWCQYWRMSSSEYGRLSAGESESERMVQRKEALRNQLERPVPPGMLAYLDGRMVGWCGFGPRPELQRLVRSRTIPAIDDRPVWAIVCFLVRVGYRRQGVARALLHGVIDYARQQRAPALEAYPVDPAGKRIDVAFAYVGAAPMFEAAGFRRVMETAARSAGLPRLLMRLELT